MAITVASSSPSSLREDDLPKTNDSSDEKDDILGQSVAGSVGGAFSDEDEAFAAAVDFTEELEAAKKRTVDGYIKPPDSLLTKLKEACQSS